MTSKERAYLRGIAAGIDTIYQVGKGGIGEESLKGISDALEARELIKVKVLETCPYTAKEAANEFAEALGAEVVGVVGRKFILYRLSERNPGIVEF